MKINLLFLLLITIQFAFSQTSEKTVSITTSGTGKTLEEAKNNALRSAIEQAFGAFISSKTEVLNDQIISDQITSVASGNIQNFDIKSQDRLPNDIWSVTLSATVSVDKLISFVQSKGIKVEINGGLYAVNIKQQILNEKAEILNMCSLIGSLHEPLQNAFDYSIQASEPHAMDENNEKWSIKLNIKATTNKNFEECANIFVNTLKSISLSEVELRSYRAMNKVFYPIKIKFGSQLLEFSFRKKESIFILKSLLDNIEYFYDEQFSVSWGKPGKSYTANLFPTKNQQYKIKKRSSLIVENRLDFVEGFKIIDNEFYDNYFYCVIDLPSINTITKVFEGAHICTLQELEELNGFEAKPNGIVSKFEYGGFVVYEQVRFSFGIQVDKTQKNLIDSVFLESAAANSGIMAGDIILKINDVELNDSNYSDLFKSTFKDSLSTFQIKRNSEILSIDLFPKKLLSKLIISPFTYEQMPKDQVMKIKDNLTLLGGYNDWKLPNYNQMEYIHKRIMNFGLGNILSYDRLYNSEGELYWCFSDDKYSGLLIDRENDNSLVINGRREIQDIDDWWGFFIPIRIQEIEIN